MADVLIFDRDADVRTVLVFCLKEGGIRAAAVATEEEALASLSEEAPSCLVLDPGAEGYGMLRKRQQWAAPSVRVLVLSAMATERDYIQAWDLGADHYMTKPFEPADVLASVRYLLSAPPEKLIEQRERERARATLLERLELAFARPGFVR